MKVLTIGRDKDGRIFTPDSAVRNRAVEYGALMQELHIVVFVLKSQGYKTETVAPGVYIHPTNSSSRWLFVWDAILMGRKVIREHTMSRADSVITCQDPFECGFVGLCVSMMSRLPLHIQIHTDFLSNHFQTSFFQRLRVFTARRVLARAVGIRVVSRRIAESLRSHDMSVRVTPQVLPIRIETPVSTENSLHLGFEDGTCVVLMASRLSSEKRIGDALRAFQHVLSVQPKTALVIVGDGPERTALERLAHDLSIAEHISFLGFRHDVFALMRSADIFLSTSEYEGYGMSVVEAGLAGLSVVASDVGVSGEILVDGRNAFVCPVGDVDCFARQMIALGGDPVLRKSLGITLQADVQKSIPTKEEYVRQYVQGLEACIRK